MKIDVVGHLGSRLSYATVAEQLIHALAARGGLGSVINLDDQWLSTHAQWQERPRTGRGDRVIVISDPQDHLIEAFASEYGRDNVSIFFSTNSNRISEERARCCRAVGTVYVPSSYCMDAVHETAGAVPCVLVPHGVDQCFVDAEIGAKTAPPGPGLRYLHVTTDTFWPGRKGTEELLDAWRKARKLEPYFHRAELTVHCLTSLYPTIHQELGDLKLMEAGVTLEAGPSRGSEPEDLLALFQRHDVLVAPSRSEGFGIMVLSALVAGMPVITTASTGQQEYLVAEQGGLIGGAMGVLAGPLAELAGEDGLAPTVGPVDLALSLLAYDRLFVEIQSKAESVSDAFRQDWSWGARCAIWASYLMDGELP